MSEDATTSENLDTQSTRVAVEFYHEGKRYALGAVFGDDIHLNSLRFQHLFRAFETSLWALGVIETASGVLDENIPEPYRSDVVALNVKSRERALDGLSRGLRQMGQSE